MINEKQSNRKRLFAIRSILRENTDTEHHMLASDIIQRLERTGQGEAPTRPTLRRDIEELREIGLKIERDQKGYYLSEREFTEAEIEVLIEGVLTSKLLTDDQTRKLIEKLEGLLSRYQKQQINKRISLTGRIKGQNEGIYESITRIHKGITTNKKIRFRYYTWDIKKQRFYHNDGEPMEVSPCFTLIDDGKYYLVGYSHNRENVRHYRIDKIEDVEITDDLRMLGDKLKNIRIEDYTRKFFGMFDGEMTHVDLVCDNSLSNTMIDRFGENIRITDLGNGSFETNVEVNESAQFYGKIFALGTSIRIAGPNEVRKRYCSYLKKIYEMYEKEN